MKTAIGLLLLASLLPVRLHSRSPQADFEQANVFYNQGKYAEALALYHELEKTTDSWKVLFNAGNALFKLNRPLEAKIYYLRARKWKPAHPDIVANIQLVNRMFKDRIPMAKPDFFTDLYLRLESTLDHTVLLILLVVFSVSLNFFLFLFLKGNRKRLIIYGGLVTFLLFSFTLFLTLSHIDRLKRIDSAVIQTDSAAIRSGPGRENTILFNVNRGLEVSIRERNQEWVQVTAGSQIAGWIEIESLQEI